MREIQRKILNSTCASKRRDQDTGASQSREKECDSPSEWYVFTAICSVVLPDNKYRRARDFLKPRTVNQDPASRGSLLNFATVGLRVSVSLFVICCFMAIAWWKSHMTIYWRVGSPFT